jgi:hypothetical protein
MNLEAMLQDFFYLFHNVDIQIFISIVKLEAVGISAINT